MTNKNHFLIDGPASISLSGGRTSARLLYEVLEAHGGSLPRDVRVLFANTGKEREETLVFLDEIQRRWHVPLRWLEYVPALGGSRVGYREVTFATAARKGEPFAAMMDHESYVPNSRTRICTKNLKVLVMHAFLRAQGVDLTEITEVIGFRADEPERVARSLGSEENAERVLRFPLHAAGITKPDVLAFWARQPFDLALEPHESNCDLCFMKGNAIRVAIMRERPELATWWIEQEETRGHRFTKRGRKTYSDLVQIARSKEQLDRDAEPALMPCGCHD